MVWSCLEENDLCTNESEFIEVGGTKKSIGRPKITLIEEVKNDISIFFFFLISKENFIKKGPSILGVYKRTNKS